ncbi:N-acetylmuramic acid 6-phosphate etherase [uncultured Cohaesibacter sp.]|uniref:N-acetylmuramic acid 6-phosphate etherase n=1 Tax=uncultured Cohaesibacter sp. TaxID=1002546 RepID=UPI002AA7A38E|nr:N-acetylmuramic acid 6-phosphate etherase [uncultured Cohaesibacter sp.]
MVNLTEKLHADAVGLDARAPKEVAALLVESQIEAAGVVADVLPDLCDGAGYMARSLAEGGSLIYAAAGSSALMMLADALELGGTFGIEEGAVRVLMAGGLPTNVQMTGDTEDETDSLSIALADIGARDTLVAVSASGSTPYTLEAARIAKQRGARIVAVAHNSDAPLLALGDCSILLQTAPEVISGSTRMGAATAQKIAMNTMSTLMAIHLGHVHDGMMVNLKVDNIKLKKRASQIVQVIADVPVEQAETALSLACDNVKLASLIAAGTLCVEEAQALLDKEKGNLRGALRRLAKPVQIQK